MDINNVSREELINLINEIPDGRIYTVNIDERGNEDDIRTGTCVNTSCKGPACTF